MSKIVFTMGQRENKTDTNSNWLGISYVPILFTISVKKTWYNRFRYWMFFKFFPFDFKEWVDD